MYCGLHFPRTGLPACLMGLVVVVCALAECDAAEISFRNEVMPALSKSGCNLGTCHGNARGKGGFQISLRGQDPAQDYIVLTRDWLSRRTNPSRPDESLLLLKPTMQVAHEGGRRFDVNSTEYQLLRDWIAAGTPDDSNQTPILKSLVVTPREVFLVPDHEGNWKTQLTVVATFSEGSQRDVTSRVVYELSRPIAEVSPAGLVTGLQSGESTVLVRFQHLMMPVRLAFLEQRSNFEWTVPAPDNVVDQHVYAKLRRMRILPSPGCDDATFVRRIHMDLLGIPPTATEARAFVANTAPDKRSRLIDDLLERPEFADWWALKWADLLRIEEKTLDRKGVENFHGWLRDAFATNKPLDTLVREIIAARGSTYEVPPANFYRALRTSFERSETAGQLFLGARLQCAKCHNHPFDRWTQDDYYSWASVFSAVDYKILENKRRDTNDQHEFDGEQIVLHGVTNAVKDPRTSRPQPPSFLGDPRHRGGEEEILQSLAGWMTSNDRFVEVLANRTWQQVIGRGIVDPVDDFRATNPPSNPELLAELVRYLRGTGSPADPRPAFSLRHLLRLILNSRTYQASSEPNDTNRDDDTNFSHAQVRRHAAEQLLDATSQVLNVPLKFSGYPTGPRAAQLPGVRVLRRRDGSPSDADQFLTVFGKPPRLQSCDCERSDETTLTQTFQMVSGALVNQMLAEPGNRLDSLSKSERSPAELVQDLYWTILTRSPTDEEVTQTSRYIAGQSSRRKALEDVAWGLLNSHEFLLRR